MSELENLIRALLENGSIRIEITISAVEQKVFRTGEGYTARCKYCSWQKSGYSTEKAAQRARNGHLAQCKKLGESDNETISSMFDESGRYSYEPKS